MITVNGEAIDGCEGITVAEYIAKKEYNMSFIAVEYNGEILPKADYSETVLKENDKLEVVCFVGGG